MESEPALVRRMLIALERGCYLAGTLLLVGTLSNTLLSQAGAAQAIGELPNMELWSETRKTNYLESLDAKPKALARLEVPSLNINVAVYATDSELHLDLGSGVIQGMDYPHENGHIGIAGHRDGYFRALKNIAVGDTLLLHTLNGAKEFVVEDLQVINPNEVGYLAATDEQRLTIVTCFPFYFVGDAPQRYLVRAVPVDSSLVI